MADADFWTELGEKFRKLDPHRSLRAECYLRTDGLAHWIPIGEGQHGHSIHVQFIPLAQRGASKLPNPDGLELLELWLGVLGPHMVQRARSLTDRLIVEGLCVESADLCAMFEAGAREAEDIAARPRPQYFYPNIVLPPGTLPVQPTIPTVPRLEQSTIPPK